VQVRRQLELERPLVGELQLPAVFLDEPVVEPVPVVLEEGAGAPLRHHHHVVAGQGRGQMRQGRGDVGVRVVAHEVLDGVQSGDRLDLRERLVDGQR